MDKTKTNIAISMIWYERYLECSRTYKTDGFVDSVWRLYMSLLNLGADKLAIKDKVDDYIASTWKPMVDNDVEQAMVSNHISSNNLPGIRHSYNLAEESLIEELFQFIIQTIQDSGIGWPTPQELQEYNITQG